MENTKTVKVLCIDPSGNFLLEDVEMKKRSYGLDICKGNASQGPEFVRQIGKNIYTYVLYYNTDGEQRNIYSDLFLNEECLCGHKSQNCNAYGNFYLEKNCTKSNHKFDFTQDITYEEFKEYDTAINCDDSDIEFIKEEIIKRSNKCWYQDRLIMFFLPILVLLGFGLFYH